MPAFPPLSLIASCRRTSSTSSTRLALLRLRRLLVVLSKCDCRRDTVFPHAHLDTPLRWDLPESILNAPKDQPVLEIALRTGFCLLADQADSEIVVGTVVLHPQHWNKDWNDKDWREDDRACVSSQNWRGLTGEGFALAAMNFRIAGAGDGQCLVTTETRVFAGDAHTAKKFARYWRVIYPGSAFIRRMWLRAIMRHAEQGTP